jgi:Raf kinase inhibitor-like YbhB/YbcL family protein
MGNGATGLWCGRRLFRTALLLTSVSLAFWLVACGSSSSGGGAGGSGAGSGGASAKGGVTGSGGAIATGGATGGAIATGGATGGTTGGTTGSGGMIATGGATSSGGAAATGGKLGTGGVARGGSSGSSGAGGTGTTATGGTGGPGDDAGATGGTSGVVDGGGGQGGGTGSGGADGPGAFTLTSPALSEGDAFLPENTCAGANTSPELDWTAGPAGTMSYAMVLTDLSNGFLHWVVWDIPPETRSLPALLPTTATLTEPAGARQVALSGTGYTGPCPNGNVHDYQFDIHALDVATLPGLSANPTTTAATDAVTTHSLAHASLGGTSNARRQ